MPRCCCFGLLPASRHQGEFPNCVSRFKILLQSSTLHLSALTQCTDVFCRLRGQHTRPESPSYDIQARTPSSINTQTEKSVDIAENYYSDRSENERIPGIERRNISAGPMDIRRCLDCKEPPADHRPRLKRRRPNSPNTVKTENETEELSSHNLHEAAPGLDYHFWKLSAVEVECKRCSERKLLSCSVLKLSPALFQSGILPKIIRLEGEPSCRDIPHKYGGSGHWRLPRIVTCP